MRVPLTVRGVFLAVTASALAGMVMGGAARRPCMGLGAGALAPDFFAQLLVGMGTLLEPLSTATVLGAIAGVLLGGGLGVFAVAIQALHEAFGRRNATRQEE